MRRMEKKMDVCEVGYDGWFVYQQVSFHYETNHFVHRVKGNALKHVYTK